MRLPYTPLLLLLITPALFPADAVYKSLREAAPVDTVLVDNLVLHRDAAVITLKSGTIAFTAPAMGRDTVAIFAGEGEFVLTPVPAIEKAYLKSLTNQESVQETFDHALFCFTDETGKEIRSQTKSHAADPKAVEILRDYRKSLRSRAA